MAKGMARAGVVRYSPQSMTACKRVARAKKATKKSSPYAAIGRALGKFYAQHARDLPWRRTQDPYAIWVSEIMLQQTQVDTVIPRYHAFLRQFPSVFVLAHATAADVCAAWAGLGYYRRARFLHAAAVDVVAHHGGKIPNTLEALLALPGIGRYTAGAIASIAHGVRLPLVDGNVARVLARLFMVAEPLSDSRGARQLWTLAEKLVACSGAAQPQPGILNQALMELGATVCSPRSPSCDACPVRSHCQAYARQMVYAYPQAAPRAAVLAMDVAFVLCRTKEGLWLSQRGLDGLWAGQWEPPSASGEDGRGQLAARKLNPTELVAQVTHQLTHRRVSATVYSGRATVRALQNLGLVPWSNPLQAPLSGLARRAIVAAEAAVL